MIEGLVVRAGEDVELSVKVQGKPFPKLSWAFNGKEMRETELVKFKKTHNLGICIVRDVTLAQQGDYVVTASNHYGSKSMALKLKVLDCPGAPEGPIEISDITQTRVRLAWGEPIDNGGSTITNYIVEKRETSRLVWTMVSENEQATRMTINKLIKGNQYVFRVSAQNKYGIGKSIQSKDVLMCNQFSKPLDPPSVPKITQVMATHASMQWTAPERDGGSIVTSYIVEKRSRQSTNWVRCTKHTVRDCNIRATGLLTDGEYEFRVAAENAAGVGPYSDATDFITIKDPLYPPAPVNAPNMKSTTSSSITIGWQKPFHDGGAAVEKYKVYYREFDC